MHMKTTSEVHNELPCTYPTWQVRLCRDDASLLLGDCLVDQRAYEYKMKPTRTHKHVQRFANVRLEFSRNYFREAKLTYACTTNTPSTQNRRSGCFHTTKCQLAKHFCNLLVVRAMSPSEEYRVRCGSYWLICVSVCVYMFRLDIVWA